MEAEGEGMSEVGLETKTGPAPLSGSRVKCKWRAPRVLVMAGALIAQLVLASALFAPAAQSADAMSWAYTGKQAFNMNTSAGNYESGAYYGVGASVFGQWDMDGAPNPFSAPELAGANEFSTLPFAFPLSSSGTEVAIDNSGGVNQGNIYMSNVYAGPPGSGNGSGLIGFDSTGTQLFRVPAVPADWGAHEWPYCGVGVDNEGDLWVGYGDQLIEYEAPSLEPTGNVITASDSLPDRPLCSSQFDGEGNIYTLAGASG